MRSLARHRRDSVWAGQQQGEWDKTGAVSILSFAKTPSAF